MNAMAFLGSVSSSGNGWLLGGLCWLVLRLLGRLDIIEKEHAATRKQVDEIHDFVKKLQGERLG